ncbi:MAG: hypothetical protein ISS45_07565 [Candidatus Omnitrophica bacterium]|nr:hypothetical protein [Candidatus Omnitrophota bacterium]
MYEDKIKKELFEKIREYDEIIKEMSGIEETDLPIPELFDTNDDYASLCVQSMDLLDEINELMLDTKYAPLTGLEPSQIKNLIFFEKSSDLSYEQNVEKHLNLRLLNLKEEMKERLKQVKTFRITSHLNPHTRHIYSEIIKCYIYGAFEASCVLCRAISETMTKKFIEYKGCGHLLVGKNKKDKVRSIQDICLNVLDMDKDIVSRYTKIGNKADNILHKKDVATEKDAIEMIKLLQDFIEKFPEQK